MKKKYARMVPTLSFEMQSSGEVLVWNAMTGKECILTEQEASFLKCLDGKVNPFRLSGELNVDGDELLKKFKRNLLIQDSRRINCEDFVAYTFPVPKETYRLRRFAAYYNLFLSIAFMPILLIGLFCLRHSSWNYVDIWWFFEHLPTLPRTLSIILGMVAGVLCHEISHAMAIWAYGGDVSYWAFAIFRHPLNPGGVVSYNDEDIRDKLKKTQISLTGVEANLLLSGILFILTKIIPGEFGGYLLVIGLVNFLEAIVNLGCVGDNDGMAVVANLLGYDEEFLENILYLVKNERSRDKVRQVHGIHGSIFIIICYIIAVMQLLRPLITICVGVLIYYMWRGLC